MVAVCGQPSTMADRELHCLPPARDLGWGQVPEPLHIRKQSSEYSGSGTYGHSRRSSTQSDATDASFETLPELPEADVPLTIAKRRGNPSAQSTNPPTPDGSCQFRSVLRPNDVGNIAPTIPPKSTQRRSTSCNAGRHPRARSPPLTRAFYLVSSRSFRRRGQVLDGSADQDQEHGWRDTTPVVPTASDGHRLRNTRSLFQLARTADGMNGMDSIVEPPRSPMPPEPDSARNSPDEVGAAPDPLVLVPRIVVTPEHKALDEGAVSLWAAVQLSTQISRANVPDQLGGCGLVGEHGHEPSPADLFRYGCLYDVSLEILPTSRSSIIEVVDDKACAISTLYPGSRLLVVVHVRLLPSANAHRLRRKAHQSSDDLIEDLEHHLGSTMTEYLRVRVTYRHSGFPQQQQQQTRNMTMKNGSSDGIANVQTSIQTTAVAVIKRHNSSSPWSPRPRAPQPNPIFKIIASHWGVQSANEVMQRIISSKPLTARKGAISPPLLGPLGILTGGRLTPILVSPEESGEEDHDRGRFSEDHTREDSHSEEMVRPRQQQDIPALGSTPPTSMAPPVPPTIPKRQTSLRQVPVDQSQAQQEVQQPQQRHLRSDTKDIAQMIKIGSWPESPRTSGGSDTGGNDDGVVAQETPSSISMATPATTSTNRTTYRSSKVRGLPSSLKISGGGGGVASPQITPMSIQEVGEVPRDSVGSTISGGNSEERERPSYQSYQSLFGRRRSLGGDGSSGKEGRGDRGRDSRDSRDSRESRGSGGRPSTSGGLGGEKIFGSIVRGIESGGGNGGMGRRVSKKEKEKEKDKERGWGGWSGWWQ
ncbi:hypothetical protein QC763_603460 [Podospora pseudopauciseta]|uniref:Uncharacterized protein n=1 Tax=Podospora pseudopauciseta TaxID=2093780 RepID=A0ABR0H3Z4_9PEZI|nr:hypothetical protein QC763_603460 [Podospora pseudopauciseta]